MDGLSVRLDAWEGPLDLLLGLARQQKVDLRRISILALVEQYLAYLDAARGLDLEVAADHLVMAAWLAYLKSVLLLPRPHDREQDADALSAALSERLVRLDAMRDAGARLMARDRLGRDVFPRGAPEGLRTLGRPTYFLSVNEVLHAYGQVAARTVPVEHRVARRPVVSLDAALSRLRAMLGDDWRRIEAFLPEDPALRRSALASGFVAALELARQGGAAIRQDAPFAPLWVRAP